MQAIITKFHGATDRKPARISATMGGGRYRVYTPFDYNLEGEEAPYRKAADILRRKFNWRGQLVSESTTEGYVFVLVP